MTVRDAEPRDLAEIARILNTEITHGSASWTHRPKPLTEIEAWADARWRAGHPILVAPASGGLAGFASYGPFRPGEGYGATVEHSVYVDAPMRRQGLATTLVGELIERARAAGLHRMVAVIGADQTGSLALHRRLGFAECGRLDEVGCKEGRWLDLVVMLLALDRSGPG